MKQNFKTKLSRNLACLAIFYAVLFLGNLSAQTITATNGTQSGGGAVPCSTCVPTGWTIPASGGTPDISNRTIAATTATAGGGANWTTSPTTTNDLSLPLPFNSHTTWLSLRDLGQAGTQESVSTTVGGLTSGRIYEVVVFSLTAVTRNNGDGSNKYAGAYNDQFFAEIAGQTITIPTITRNVWGVSKIRFTANAASQTLVLRPGNNASAGTSTTPIFNGFETVQIAVTANAVNTAPTAVADNRTTVQGTPLTINVLNNDVDQGGGTIDATSVDLDPATPNVQSTFTNTQGTWSVSATGLVTFSPVAGFVGTATIPYTVNDNYSINNQSAAATSAPANISVTVLAADTADTDGDGYANNVDLDDDNDGILDCVENGLAGASFANNDIFNKVGTTAQGATSDIAQLTSAANDQRGQLWSVGKIDFTKNFSFTFDAFLGASDAGADGIAIVFHNSPAGSSAIGSAGSGMGAGGIANGLVLELDTYNNGTGVGDISQDHGHIWRTGSQTGAGLTTAVALPNLEDGLWHPVVVTWNAATQTITYTVDGITAGTLTTANFANTYFGATKVFFGYTASTGGSNNQQQIRINDFCDVPIELDTDGDGVSNHLDLDSDKDGCFDALEGDGTVMASQLSQGRISGPVNSNGVPTAVGAGQGIGTSQNASQNQCTDTDFDGVPDYLDLDDDNDGILDTAEDTCTTKTAEGSPVFVETFGTGNTQVSNANVLGHSFVAISPGDGSYSVTRSLDQTNTYSQTNRIGNLDAGYTTVGNGSTEGRYLMININSGTYNTEANPIFRIANLTVAVNRPHRFRIDLAGLVDSNPVTSGDIPNLQITVRNAATNAIITSVNSSNLGVLNDDIWRRLILNFTPAVSKINIEIANLQASGSNGNDVGIDNIVLTPLFCDSDNDGIPNQLDPDSDGDGCPDAVEGSERVQYNQVHPLTLPTSDPNYPYRGQIKVGADGINPGTPSGIISNDPSVPSGRGVPRLVNSASGNPGFGTSTPIGAGIADNTENPNPTADVGQGIGTAQAVGATDPECARCFRQAASPGIGGEPTNHGITALNRAGAENGNWPMRITGAYTALDARTNGMVINRVPFTGTPSVPTGINSANFVRGMMVYDTTNNCLKIYDGTGWFCFTKQTCDNFNQ